MYSIRGHLCICSSNFLLLGENATVYSMTIEPNTTEQYFPVQFLIQLYKVVLNFESADESLKCDHSNEN